jgi:hypothetical protein
MEGLKISELTVEQFEGVIKKVVKESLAELRDLRERPHHVKIEQDDFITKHVQDVRLLNIMEYNTANLFGRRLPLHLITIKDLERISKRQFMKQRNAGKGSLSKLMELCQAAGINLQP